MEDNIAELRFRDACIAHDWEVLDTGKAAEKTDLNKAIFIYERFVSIKAHYPLPYQRLSVLYRKQKCFDDEIRVLDVAIEVFEREGYTDQVSESKLRRQKAVELRAKQEQPSKLL